MMLARTQTARLLFAGGGTGGHLYPAIAIADRVRELIGDRMNVEIKFVGTPRGLEYRIRESLGYPLEIINVRGLARSMDWKNLLVPFLLIGALIKTRSFMQTFDPDVVVGTGGYVSWPVLRIAALKNVPTVLQEQNSFPGITTRKFASRAKRVYLGFEKAREFLKPGTVTIVTGNPVRRTIANGNRAEAQKTFNLNPARKTILVLGGSQGAHAVNSAVIRSIEQNAIPEDCQLLWQTGKRDYTDVITAIGDKVQGHTLFPFENRMELVYAAADIAVARAGAITLAELEACAVPSVLIPYPFAAGDHQRKNAEEFVSKGIATMIDEKELSAIDLMAEVGSLIAGGKSDQMHQTLMALRTGKKPAVDIIAEDIIQMIATAA